MTTPVINHSYTSPNHSSRLGHPITLLVIHATAGSLQSSLNWLCSEVSHVSSHYVIGKNGPVYQLVPDLLAAWHAGASAWPGFVSADEIQRASLGIELENANDGHDPYPPAQIQATLALCRSLVASYDIARENVVRHLDIATPKGRKTDPAGFPWVTFLAALFPPPPPPTPPPAPAADWIARWGPVATPTTESWSWDAPTLWKAHWERLGKCLSQALYDTTNGIYVQAFEGGDVRGIGSRWEVTFK